MCSGEKVRAERCGNIKLGSHEMTSRLSTWANVLLLSPTDHTWARVVLVRLLKIGFILKTFAGSGGFIPSALTVLGIDRLWATSDRWRRRPQAAEVHRGRTWSGRTGLGCRAGSGGRCARSAAWLLLQLLDSQHDRRSQTWFGSFCHPEPSHTRWTPQMWTRWGRGM